MTKIGKRLAAVFLAVAMVVTFIPVLGTQTVYAVTEYDQQVSVYPAGSGLVNRGGSWQENGGHSWIAVGKETRIWTEPKPGYVFSHWTKGSPDGEVLGTDLVYEYTVYGENYFYAVFEPTSEPQDLCTVTFDTDGGEEIASQSVIRGSHVEYVYPEKTGCTFKDWFLDPSFTEPFYLTMDTVDSDITLYAKWNDSIPEYEQTFSVYPEGTGKISHNGSAWYETSGSSWLKDGINVTINAEPKEGFRFKCWAKNTPDGEVMSTDPESSYIVSGALRLYAVFEEEEVPQVMYTVSFETNGGTAIESVQVVANTHLEYVEPPVKEGYLFKGWFKDPGFTQPFYFATDTIDSNMTLYAKWEDVTVPITDARVTGVENMVYTGKAVAAPVVTIGIDTILREDIDYTVSYKDLSGKDVAAPTNVGTYTVIITGKGDYKGSIEKTFIIKAKSITPAVTLSASAFTYNGKVKKPTVTVKDGSTKLAASQYTVTYASGRKNVGTYKVTVKMKGNYSGSKTVSFKINPKGATLSKVTKAKKAATVKWKKQAAKMSTSRITGYQIQLATDSKFTKNKKTVNVKGYSKTSKKVTGLKGGKKYYVRIRTYKKVGSTTYYSPWSKAKTVTTGK